MKKIWAPWRIKYILGKKPDKCFLCIKETNSSKKKHFVLLESKYSYVILNRFPYTAGHLMVIPRRHVSDLEGMTLEEMADFFLQVRVAVTALKKAVCADGINLGANLGKAAGAGAEEHFHFHVVARWNGDHNFMPVMSSTMVISECIEETYKRLLPYFM